MVDLISTQLDEMPGINAIDPNLVFSKIDEEKVYRSLELATKLSKYFNAGQFILGNILELEGVLRITASKYDNDGKKMNTISVDVNEQDQLTKAVDDLTRKIIAKEMERRGLEFNSLGALTSTNMESLKAFLKGEQM